MSRDWQESFLEKLVSAAHTANDERLASALLRPRKKTVSLQHPQVRQIECSFARSRKMGSQGQVLLIDCQPKRGTEIDEAILRREFQETGLGGEVDSDHESVCFQFQWGHGNDAVFPVQDARRVKELTQWAVGTLTILFDHLEQQRILVTPSRSGITTSPSFNLRVTLEQYLEDLLVQEWENLPWAAELEYLDRQVECGSLGRIDILARSRANGDYVVVELKKDKGEDEVVGQLSRYMGWITEHRAKHTNANVRGIIIAHEITEKLRSAILPHPDITVYTYQFSVALNPFDVRTESHTSKDLC